MTIYNHFSSYTRLPVQINDIRDFVLGRNYVDEIRFYGVDINSDHLRGMCHVYLRQVGVYCEPLRCAEISFAKSLSEHEKRIVLCKELLHLTENPAAAAQTSQQVDQLIEEIAVPLTFKASLQGISDHCGELNAIRVLLPDDAREILQPQIASGALSLEDVASIAKMPIMHCRIAFHPRWCELTRTLDDRHNGTA